QQPRQGGRARALRRHGDRACAAGDHPDPRQPALPPDQGRADGTPPSRSGRGRGGRGDEGEGTMSGEGSPDLARTDATGLRVAVVASSWHTTVMDGLVEGATKAL